MVDAPHDVVHYLSVPDDVLLILPGIHVVCACARTTSPDIVRRFFVFYLRLLGGEFVKTQTGQRCVSCRLKCASESLWRKCVKDRIILYTRYFEDISSGGDSGHALITPVAIV